MTEPSPLRGPELDVAMMRHNMASRHAYQILTREGKEDPTKPRIGCPICSIARPDAEAVAACMEGHRRTGDQQFQEWLTGQYESPEVDLARLLGQDVFASYKRDEVPADSSG